MLKGDKAKAILESNLDYLRISVYSVIQEKHEILTKSKINIEDIYNNVVAFKNMREKSGKNKPFIYAKIIDTFTDENDLFIEKYKDATDEVGVIPPNNWNESENFIAKAYGKNHPVQNNNREVCAFLFYQLHISNNGDVKLCCADYIGYLKIGNIKTNCLNEMWNSEILHNIQIDFLERKQKKYSSCKNCNFFNSNEGFADIDSISSSEIKLKRSGKQ